MFRACIQSTYKASLSKQSIQRFPINHVKAFIPPSQPLWKRETRLKLTQYNSINLPGNSRWQSTQVKPLRWSDLDEGAKWVVIEDEKQYTKTQKEWKLSESESNPPEVIRPLLYFIGVGAGSYTLAAYLTMKDTRNALEESVILQ